MFELLRTQLRKATRKLADALRMRDRWKQRALTCEATVASVSHDLAWLGRKDWGWRVDRWRSLVWAIFDDRALECVGRHATGYEADFALGIICHESSGDHLARSHLEWIGDPPPGYDPDDDTTRATGLCQHVPAYWASRSMSALGRVGNILDPVDQLEVMAWLVYHKPEWAPNWQHWPDAPDGSPGSTTVVRGELAGLYPEVG